LRLCGDHVLERIQGSREAWDAIEHHFWARPPPACPE